MTLVASAGVKATSLTLSAGLIVGSDILSDSADVDSLGSTSKEWLNLYIGDSGKIYLGVGQDVSLNRSAANTLTVTASSGVVLTGGLTVGSDIVSDTADTDSLGSTTKEFLNLYIGDAGKIYLGLSQDVNLYRSSANVLKTDDSFVIGSSLSVDSVSEYTGSAGITFSSLTTQLISETSIFTIKSTTSDAYLYIDSNDDGLGIEQSAVIFLDNGVEKWLLGKQSNNSFILYDYDGLVNTFSIVSGTPSAITWAATHNFGGYAVSNLGVSGNNFTAAGQLQLPTSGSSGGILLGGDVNLYRIAANILATDNGLKVVGDYGIYLAADRKLYFGNGSSVYDINLYRGGANILKTDDSLEVTGVLYPYGGVILGSGDNIALSTTTGTQIGTATNQLLGFYGATPVDQPATVSDATTQDLTGTDQIDQTKLESDLSGIVTAVNTVKDRLQELGLIA